MKSQEFTDEALAELYEFARCQRADGSYYGTGGQCRKGAPAEPKEKTTKKSVPPAMKKELSALSKGDAGALGKRFNDSKKEIGEGAYGAVKETPEGTIIKKGMIGPVEAKVQQRLSDVDGVPKLLDVAYTSKPFEDRNADRMGIIEMEKARGKPLGAYKDLSNEEKGKVIDEYIRVRKDMHQRGVAHNDFHDNNFFYDRETGKGGAIDFGLSQLSRKGALREAMGFGREEMDIQSAFLIDKLPQTATRKRLTSNIAKVQKKLQREGYNDLDLLRGNTTVAEAKQFVNDIYEGI